MGFDLVDKSSALRSGLMLVELANHNMFARLLEVSDTIQEDNSKMVAFNFTSLSQLPILNLCRIT